MMRKQRRRDSNGTAWRRARAAVLRTEDVCALCGRPVDKALRSPHPMSPEVDHILPVIRGGHLTARSNLQLTHRACNRRKGDGSTPRVEPMRMSRAW